MSRLPIRLRLTFVFARAMAVVLAGATWLLYLQVGSDLGSGIDQSLRSRAQDVGALVRDGGSLRSTSSPLIESGESFAELVSPNGRVLDASASLHRAPLLLGGRARAAHARSALAEPSVGAGLDEPTRMLAVRSRTAECSSSGARGKTVPRRSAAAHGIPHRRPGRAAARGARRVPRRGAALRPIEGMRRRAEEISTSSLDERLPVPATGERSPGWGRR